MKIRLTTAALKPNLARRQLAGTLFRYGEVGLTSNGPLAVQRGAIEIPEDLGQVLLTREHERDVVRGHLAVVDDTEERLYIVVQVDDGPAGDEALADAQDRARAAFSYDIEDTEVVDGVIVKGRLVFIGQVSEPAYNSARIDQIAASRTTGASRPNTTGGSMTPEQIARLAELRSQDTRTPEEEAELQQLLSLAADQVADAPQAAADDTPPAAAPAQTAASLPAVPRGTPRPTTATVVREPHGSALRRMVREVTAALAGQRAGTPALPGITAALSDVISTDHTENIEQVAWSSELWSGLEYEPVFSDLLTPDTLTSWEGKGWRFVTTPDMQDYAGDKAAIPSGTVTTEDSTYEAARMAVGVDIDRKFYDFPNEGFVNGLFERIRESWEIKLDAKAKAYIVSAANTLTRTATVATTNGDATVTAAAGTFSESDEGAAISGTGIPASTTILSVTNSGSIELSANATATGGAVTATIGIHDSSVLKVAAKIGQRLRNTRVGRDPWLVFNDDDMLTLLDVTADSLPAFLQLWNVKPENFRSSPDVAKGTVLGGVKAAAKLRVLPGSPIRVSAQHLANGGIDEAFFGYWAVEEHHPTGIVKATFTAAA